MRRDPQQKNQHHYPRRAVTIPNHCSNSLTVTGPGAKDFFAKVEADEEKNFVAVFVPMPDEMKNIHTGHVTINGESVSAWRIIDGENVAVSELDLAHMTDLYGTSDWYHWCNANWGTKWGAYDMDYDGKACIHFDSAWSPPIPAVRTISEMFPKATFELAFAEGGSGFYGSMTFRNGRVVAEFEGKDFWDEAAEDDDEGDYLSGTTPECAAFLEAHGLHTGG